MLKVCVWRWCYWACTNFQILGDLSRDHLKLKQCNGVFSSCNRRSLFMLNSYCAELRIMDVKLRCDLFNMLVRSITSYACEVWVDSKKIKAIEVVYRGFFKSLLGPRKTTNTSIMLKKLASSPLNTLHGDNRCYIINVWAWSLKTASWERHGKPNSLCLVREKKC